MRRTFADLLYDQMASRPIVLLTADLGFGFWDRIADAYPDRFVNVGAAEQCMIGVAVGMARAGLVPVCYSITPFLLYRPFELVRQYLDHEGVAVKLAGSGRDRDYLHDGFTHWAEDDASILAKLPGIQAFWPDTPDELRAAVEAMLQGGRPAYLNLRRQ